MVRSQFDDPPVNRQYYQRNEHPRAQQYQPRNEEEDRTRIRDYEYYNRPGTSQYRQQQPIPNPGYVYPQYGNYGQTLPFQQSSYPHGYPSMSNQIGSIVGLRVVQLDTGLGYVPVEPHINYIINQQFGRGGPVYTSTPLPPQLGNYPVISQGQTITASSTSSSIAPADPGPHREVPPRAQSHDPPIKRPPLKEIEDDWFKPTPQPKSGVRRSAHWRNDPEEPYDPWGRGGAGAPMRDSSGQIIADRGKLRAFRNRAGSLANLSLSDATQAVLTRQTMDQPLSSQEQHKLELMRQIEENKRRKEIERQKELEIERREMQKLEEYNAKIRLEEEAERKKERNRAAAMERRAAAMAAEQDARARQPRRRPSPPLVENPRAQGRRGSEMVKQTATEDEEELPPRLEWWERKPNYDDSRKSAVIPTMRNGAPSRPTSRGRHTYSPADSVRQHQSREQSREAPASRVMSSKPSRRASVPPRPPNLDDERPIKPAGSVNRNAPYDD